MGKSYYEEKIEKAQLTYELLAEMIEQKCRSGEVKAENIALYASVLTEAKGLLNLYKKEAREEKTKKEPVTNNV